MTTETEMPCGFAPGSLRVHIDEAGQRWYSAFDVGKVCKMSNTPSGVLAHVDASDAIKLRGVLAHVDASDAIKLRGPGNPIYLTEVGVYSLALGRNKNKHKDFNVRLIRELVQRHAGMDPIQMAPPSTAAPMPPPVQEIPAAPIQPAPPSAENKDVSPIEDLNRRRSIVGYWPPYRRPRLYRFLMKLIATFCI